MPRYIALLRGVNLGGHTVKMDKLKKHFEELGFKKVETFIASGNVIFETPSKSGAALEKKIAAHLEKSLGFPARTFLRRDDELAAVLADHPFERGEGENLYIGFLSEAPPKAARASLMKYANADNEFHVNGREAYWFCRNKQMNESTFFRVGLEKALGLPVTVRNVTTISKLVEKYPKK